MTWYGLLRLAVIVFSLGVIAGWLVQVNQPPLRYTAATFRVERSPHQSQSGPVELRIGDTIRYVVERCNTTDRDLDYETTTELVRVDATEEPLLTDARHDTSFSPGCERKPRSAFVVPPTAQLGASYRVRGKATVPTVFGKTVVPWKTEDFIVVAKAASAP